MTPRQAKSCSLHVTRATRKRDLARRVSRAERVPEQNPQLRSFPLCRTPRRGRPSGQGTYLGPQQGERVSFLLDRYCVLSFQHSGAVRKYSVTSYRRSSIFGDLVWLQSSEDYKSLPPGSRFINHALRFCSFSVRSQAAHGNGHCPLPL